jgi:glycosyltransferase involved in cell wall biosynthesis
MSEPLPHGDDSPYRVSVVIPVYNGALFLNDAVDSVLSQSCAPAEVIVVDDGSTDGTPALAAARGDCVRYLRQPHRGLPATRNRGVQAARGNVIGFLDVDDLWSRDKLALQLTHMRENPRVPIVLGHTQLMRLIGSEGEALTFEVWGAPVLAMSTGGALFRADVFAQVGLFDETQMYCDDVDWFMRAKEHGVAVFVHPEVTLYYRRHSQNMTNQADVGKRFLIGMLKKSMDRRGRRG